MVKNQQRLSKMNFIYTPHIESILRGRGLFKDGSLRCCATHCIFEVGGKGFGREIVVMGTVKCPDCGSSVIYPDDLEFQEAIQKAVLKCPVCKSQISLKIVKWTQNVISKHHRSKHLYFHKECFDLMYRDVKGDEEDVGATTETV
jgi:DNA-directed RNA polymerase subunit RPC12/RpoP